MCAESVISPHGCAGSDAGTFGPLPMALQSLSKLSGAKLSILACLRTMISRN